MCWNPDGSPPSFHADTVIAIVTARPSRPTPARIPRPPPAKDQVDDHHGTRGHHDRDPRERGLPVGGEDADVDGRHPTR